MSLAPSLSFRLFPPVPSVATLRTLAVAMGTLAGVLAQTCLAQPAPGSAAARPIPGNPQAEAMMRALEAQRPAFEAYQNCVGMHRREVELHYAADNLVRFREQRSMLEAALLNNPEARARYPGGAQQMIDAELDRYRALGGTAGSLADVRSIPSPCPTPGPVMPQRPSGNAPPAITERRSMTVPAP